MSIWKEHFDMDFAKCEKCKQLPEHEEDNWCRSCKQNFAYIWRLENRTQILQAGMDKMSKMLLGLSHVINPDKDH